MTTPVLGGREPAARMSVAISGSSGLIGSALCRSLEQRGAEVRPLVRRAARSPNEIEWDPERGTIDASRLEGIEAVVNLAGENLAQRWTSGARRRIRDSRVKGTTLLARTLTSLAAKPAVFLSGSAMGIYGDRGDEALDESSSLGDNFLAEICKAWEAATTPAIDAGIRVVHLRTGLVLSKDGGALPKILIPFRLGVGGRLGKGTQWMSWIGIDDYVRAAEKLLVDEISGPVNLVAPNPVTNQEFSGTLSKVLRRPAFFAVPSAVLKLALGDMGEDTLLASQRIRPRRLLDAGFEFLHPTLESALRAIVIRPRA